MLKSICRKVQLPSCRRIYFSNCASMVILAFNNLEMGQPAFAAAADFSNADGSAPGTLALTCKCTPVSWDTGLLISCSQSPIQIKGRADERHVGESLREITERPAVRTRLFGIQPQMIGKPKDTFEQEPGLIQP
jgi:hypothetical protein